MFEALWVSGMNPKCPPISKTITGSASTMETHSRRVISASSPPSCSLPAISGSSDMPQIGHKPGPNWRTSGCMGQV